MTVGAAQADAFYREAVDHGCVWTIRDEGGLPAPMTDSGQRAMPFWSLRSRAQRVVETVPAYAGFTVDEAIALDVWLDRWVPGLERDGLLVGLNWSGERATGYDVSPADLVANLAARAELGP